MSSLSSITVFESFSTSTSSCKWSLFCWASVFCNPSLVMGIWQILRRAALPGYSIRISTNAVDILIIRRCLAEDCIDNGSWTVRKDSLFSATLISVSRGAMFDLWRIGGWQEETLRYGWFEVSGQNRSNLSARRGHSSDSSGEFDFIFSRKRHSFVFSWLPIIWVISSFVSAVSIRIPIKMPHRLVSIWINWRSTLHWCSCPSLCHSPLFSSMSHCPRISHVTIVSFNGNTARGTVGDRSTANRVSGLDEKTKSSTDVRISPLLKRIPLKEIPS